MTLSPRAHRPGLLWVDCLGGLIVGAGVLVLASWLARLYGLPHAVVIAMGVANLVYGSYSLFVQLHSERTTGHIALLAGANIAWLGVCAAITALHAPSITLLGVIGVMGEGLYVAGLGALEWTRRAQLVT